jgi:hypothetical protein
MKTDEIILTSEFTGKVAELYHDMEASYDKTARDLDFSCTGCPDNCCDSFFLHHTYTEWAYLWHGLQTLDDNQLEIIKKKASAYVVESEATLVKGERPIIMCPLNSKGLCTLYRHRMMICRLHGVPATFTRPDGKQLSFPGCFRCQELLPEKEVTPMDRTQFFKRLVNLEVELLGNRRRTAPRVKLTIAQMIVKGPPVL